MRVCAQEDSNEKRKTEASVEEVLLSGTRGWDHGQGIHDFHRELVRERCAT